MCQLLVLCLSISPLRLFSLMFFPFSVTLSVRFLFCLSVFISHYLVLSTYFPQCMIILYLSVRLFVNIQVNCFLLCRKKLNPSHWYLICEKSHSNITRFCRTGVWFSICSNPSVAYPAVPCRCKPTELCLLLMLLCKLF